MTLTWTDIALICVICAWMQLLPVLIRNISQTIDEYRRSKRDPQELFDEWQKQHMPIKVPPREQ